MLSRLRLDLPRLTEGGRLWHSINTICSRDTAPTGESQGRWRCRLLGRRCRPLRVGKFAVIGG